MALSKLKPLNLSFIPLQTPTQNPQPPSHLSFPNPNLSLQLKTLHLSPAPITLPNKIPLKTLVKEEEKAQTQSPNNFDTSLLSVAFPSLAFSNTLFFKSAYNVQVIVGPDEPEENLVSRFRREVLRAGIIQECKRRRNFECSQDKVKRKRRDAARRNRKRRYIPKVSKDVKAEDSKKKRDDVDDNWEYLDIKVPYC